MSRRIKTSNIILFVVLILCVVLLCMGLFSVLAKDNDININQILRDDGTNSHLNATMIENDGMSIYSYNSDSSLILEYSFENLFCNDKVIWTTEFKTSNVDSVSNYITTTTYDNSISIRCLKKFNDVILITCKSTSYDYAVVEINYYGDD